MADCDRSMPYQLTKLSGGHSGADLYRLEISKQAYLLKVFPSDFSEKRFDCIAEICKLYQNLGIKSLNLIKRGKTTTGQPFCIYNYIDSNNYEEVGKLCTVEENYRVGHYVGSSLSILKNTQPSLKMSKQCEDINKLIQNIAANFLQLLSNPDFEQLALQYYNIADLKSFAEELISYSTLFDDIKPYLIHGDIKRSNVILDAAGNIWLIDIESMKMSYDIMNFRHQMIWFLSSNDERKMGFLKGVFDGLYGDNYPIDFWRQIRCITLLNFCEHTVHCASKPETLRGHLDRMRHTFAKIWG